MKNTIDDYINGNLAAAREGAKRFSLAKLTATLIREYGHTPFCALQIAGYLKGRVSFDSACEAERIENEARQQP